MLSETLIIYLPSNRECPALSQRKSGVLRQCPQNSSVLHKQDQLLPAITLAAQWWHCLGHERLIQTRAS